MNTEEKGRIDKAEQAIVGLSGRMDGFDDRLTKVEEVGQETNDIAHKLLARQGGYEATRGMIPITYLWSGMALFVGLSTLGTKMLWDHDSKIEQKLSTITRLEDMRHQLFQSKLDAGTRLADADVKLIRDDVDENNSLLKETSDKVDEILQNRWTLEMGRELQERVSAIEVSSARNNDLHNRLDRIESRQNAIEP